jgi:serine/threonine-protein kinase haspin
MYTDINGNKIDKDSRRFNMSRPGTLRKYGKQSQKPRAERLFAELPQSPVRLMKTAASEPQDDDPIHKITEQLTLITIQDENLSLESQARDEFEPIIQHTEEIASPAIEAGVEEQPSIAETDSVVNPPQEEETLRVITWEDVCPPGDRIEKIAEASFAEVYRVINERGLSIIKVIRLESPLKPQTKAQERSGLVDEESHSEDDLRGELRISEWLADIPGFVVYKERYIVQGKASRELLETHQAFHKKAKRQDPDRLQFYPSPSRYLNDTKFLVVELGDAGKALEDFALEYQNQLWDIFFHVAIALARAEDLIMFEVSSCSRISQNYRPMVLTIDSIAISTRATYALDKREIRGREHLMRTRPILDILASTLQYSTTVCPEQRTLKLKIAIQLHSTWKET